MQSIYYIKHHLICFLYLSLHHWLQLQLFFQILLFLFYICFPRQKMLLSAGENSVFCIRKWNFLLRKTNIFFLVV